MTRNRGETRLIEDWECNPLIWEPVPSISYSASTKLKDQIAEWEKEYSNFSPGEKRSNYGQNLKGKLDNNKKKLDTLKLHIRNIRVIQNELVFPADG